MFVWARRALNSPKRRFSARAVIGDATTFPRYDERFRGYGLNKCQQLYACDAAGFRFVV